MGRKRNIGWGVSNYFGLPNRKRKLLTVEFLEDFKNEILIIDRESKKDEGLSNEANYDEKTYLNFYGHIDGSYLFYKALEVACKKHNITKAIYEYAVDMPWYDSDCFEDHILLEMVHKGVIKYDNDTDESDDYEDELPLKYKIVTEYKGYNVVEYGSWFEESKGDLENIYKDSKSKLIWLN